jgi:hypothetical protein
LHSSETTALLKILDFILAEWTEKLKAVQIPEIFFSRLTMEPKSLGRRLYLVNSAHSSENLATIS